MWRRATCAMVVVAMMVIGFQTCWGEGEGQPQTQKYHEDIGFPHRHPHGRRFEKLEVLSRPVKLKVGEVHNTVQEPVMLPKHVIKKFKHKTMAIVDYVVDIVGFDEKGREFQVPLYDAYNHHYLMGMGGYDDMKKFYDFHKNDPYGGFDDNTEKKSPSVHTLKNAMMQYMDELNQVRHPAENRRKRVAGFGGGSGAEERGTSHRLPVPYAHVVDSPEALMPLLHVINTKNSTPGEYSPLLECPCTPQRNFDIEDGHIDGRRPIPPFSCNTQLMLTKNPSCDINLYEGGFRCCEHGVFLIDTDKHSVDTLPESTFYFKFTFYYMEDFKYRRHQQTIPVRPPACCDVTGNLSIGGNVEFDVPKCAEGTPPEECIYELSTVQYIDLVSKYHTNESTPQDPNAEIELIYAVGHLHVGGLSLDLYNDETGELLCHSEPTYGKSAKAGDEENYLVGMSACVYGTRRHRAPLLKKSTMVRVVARYNSTVNHHGVMALWLMDVADVPPFEDHHYHHHNHHHNHASHVRTLPVDPVEEEPALKHNHVHKKRPCKGHSESFQANQNKENINDKNNFRVSTF